MADEKGRWITLEGRHIFIRNGESVDQAVKRAWGVSKTDDQKDKQIENNKKQADELNAEKKKHYDGTDKNVKDADKVNLGKSDKTASDFEKPEKKLSKEDLQKLVEKHKADKQSETDDVGEEKAPKNNTMSGWFTETKKAVAKEGVLPNGDFQMADGRIAKPAPEGTTSNEDGKYFSPDWGKHWYEDPKSEDDKPWWGDNPPAPKLPVGQQKKVSDEPDENGLYDITDKWHQGTSFKNDLFNKNGWYADDRATRFAAGVGEDAQEALDVLSDNAQGIFIDCPHDTEISFKDSQGRTIQAKARQDNQGRISWTLRIDDKRSGSGWSSRDVAGMLPSNPKDFSMHIPHTPKTSEYNSEQPDIKIDIKEGKVSKSVRSTKRLKTVLEEAEQRSDRWHIPHGRNGLKG